MKTAMRMKRMKNERRKRRNRISFCVSSHPFLYNEGGDNMQKLILQMQDLVRNSDLNRPLLVCCVFPTQDISTKLNVTVSHIHFLTVNKKLKKKVTKK